MSTVANPAPVSSARKSAAPSAKTPASKKDVTPADEPTASPGRLGDKRAAQVARRIEDDVAAAGWPVGEVLGTEAELTERYGVSRSVLREAVRLVEHHQVAQMRRGPGGGLIVQAPDMKGATAALVIYLEFLDTSVADLMDVRLILEPLAVGLATRRLTESGIETLRRAVAEESAVLDQRPAAGLPDRFHPAVASASGNAVLQLFLDILNELSTHYAARPPRMSRRDVAALDAGVRKEHSELVDAIISGNEVRAQHLAAEHMEAMRALLLESKSNRRAWSSGTARPSAGKVKLAEVVAEQIRGDLVQSGASVGDWVGSEAELRERYAVSRQVLREAVRLLEHHGVAKMRRGPGGGLFVAEPDPWSSIESIAVYLGYQGIDVEDLRVVRDAVELACLDRVLALEPDPALAARLEQALQIDSAAPMDEVRSAVHDIHRELADRSGNPVLSLFLRVLTSLWERHGMKPPVGTSLTPPEVLREMEDAHAGIVDAVLSGDGQLARHRMMRHLEALTAWWH